jgi:hypothetical protein
MGGRVLANAALSIRIVIPPMPAQTRTRFQNGLMRLLRVIRSPFGTVRLVSRHGSKNRSGSFRLRSVSLRTQCVQIPLMQKGVPGTSSIVQFDIEKQYLKSVNFATHEAGHPPFILQSLWRLVRIKAASISAEGVLTSAAQLGESNGIRRKKKHSGRRKAENRTASESLECRSSREADKR